MTALKRSVKIIFDNGIRKHRPLIFSKRVSALQTYLPESTLEKNHLLEISNSDTLMKVKPLSDMPGPTAWPLIGNFLTYIHPKNVGRLHEVQREQHKQYGKIFQEKLGFRTHVHVCDPELISHVFRNHGKHPSRPSFQSWVEHRKSANKPLGLLTAEGHVWYKIRKHLNQKMLKPKFIAAYCSELNNVVDDAIHRLRTLRDTLGDDLLPAQMPNEVYKWTFESIGTVLFETRMGSLQQEIPKKPQEFIDAIVEMNRSSLYIIIGETLHKKFNTPLWQSHRNAWDTIFEIAQSYVDDRLPHVKELSNNSEVEGRGELLSHLLSCEDLSMDDIYANITEVLVGGIDTTSNTMCFLLYLLANHPEVQKKLQEEVDRVTKGEEPTVESFKEMPYLKCVVKETLRLYPVVTMNVRVLKEKIILDGYEIPEETLLVLNNYAASRADEVFENADVFLPERWDRKNEREFHSFASLPFGFGSRSCIGRRIAEMALYLIASRMMQQFTISKHPTLTLKPQLRTLLTVGEKLPIILHDRK